MDKQRFQQSMEKATAKNCIRNGIGTLSERTLHAVLKRYFDSSESNHEIKVGAYIADIVNPDGIIEIQTRAFNKLRNKLEAFLAVSCVTVVYPVARTKWLLWIDETTGEITKKRKSPKKGTPAEIFYELYKIKPFLTHPNFRLCIVLLDMDEYRRLDGWSTDKKKGSSRYERIPTDIADEIHIDTLSQYGKLIPDGLPVRFTAKDFKASSSLSHRNAQTALNVLRHVGAVEQVGKSGNQYLYESRSEMQ